MADNRTVREVLESLAVAENGGDVRDNLSRLAELLGEQPPVICDECERPVWPWEPGFDPEYGHREDYVHDE